MSDAAQGELLNHEVFTTPLKVEPQYENWPTPANYRQYPGGKDLPDTFKVWRVQNTGKDFGSVVSSGAGFLNAPDAEILTLGYNVGKGPREAGVSRQGNFLQWGFNGSPKQMTEAGKRFFINCIVYIRKFDGKAALIRRSASDRSLAPMYASYISSMDDASFVERVFGPAIRAKFKGEPKSYAADLAKYLEANMEFIYYGSSGFEVDEDLKGLGVASNRKVETLEKLMAMRSDALKKPTVDKILARYLDAKVATPTTVEKWFADNRDCIFFTDVGGYKFLAAPKGYLNSATTQAK
jgi:hypothetical protein